MKKIVKSFFIAFAMYSKIPMPRTDWSEENMRYAFCFFPLVGAVTGAAFYGVFYLCGLFGFNDIFTAALLTVTPVLITGGLHLDGYLDTMDALSSYQSKERRLEILKDVHKGAFAVIMACVYFSLYFGAASQITGESILIVCIGFVLSRSLTGFSVVNFKSAKETGIAAAFKKSAGRGFITVVLCLFIAASAAGMLILDLIIGGAVLLSAAVAFLWYGIMSHKKFGGITGDLAGWSLQMCELFMILAAAITGVILLWI